MSQNPFRFGVVAVSAVDGAQWTATARWAQDAGFASLLLPDLPAPVPAPFTALATAATVTTTLEVGTWVLANDFRNPVVVAREAATLDLLSGGRFRLGLGAGQPANGYEALGIPVEPGATRVQRLAESVRIVNALLRGERVDVTGRHYAVAGASLQPPPARKPPLLIAAGGRRATELAAAEADTVALSTFSADRIALQVGWLADAAGSRFTDLELALRFSTPSSTVGPPIPADSPNLLGGSAEQVVDHLLRLRDRFGISYVVLDEMAARELEPVVRRLAGV
ncbi:LLM class flavin-dependent oxidoreductase [Nocardia higoensis]|uniref:LLM class flavin-dependent oxidoreductase n=1 Tax=Nocardia higoensis TaxID=228599 RepID=UPI0002F73FC0|nr:LLM class flavin-dependent oxidoreductase [Nocardia higoensis]